MSTVAGPPASRPDLPVRGERRIARPATATPPPSRPTPRQFVRRRRLALGAGALAFLIAAAVALVLVLGRSGEAPPATGAAAIVPADALAYVSLSTDTSRSATTRAGALAARFPDWPLLRTAALNRLRALVGGSSSADFATALRPWLGKEAALALLGSLPGDTVEPLVVLEVGRQFQAREFVRKAGATPAGIYRGARLLRYASGTELAFVGHYLVAAPDAGVRAAIDAARNRVPALAHESAYERAVAGEPADRVLDGYLPASGIRRLLASRSGVAGAIGGLLDRPGFEGAAISVSAASTGARVLVHTVLGARSAATRSFGPTLQSVLPPSSSLMLDVAGLDHAAPALLRAAATAGIATNVGPLLSRVGAALKGQGVGVHKVVSLFDGETAVALAPGATPALLIVARVRDQQAARNELAALEGPVTTIFTPSGGSAGGQMPELADRVVGGTTIHEVQLGPGLQVEYAVTGGLVVISTSVQAIDAVAERSRSLGDEAAYRAALRDRPKQVSSVVFGEVTQLLRLGQQMGLTGGALTRELLPDLSRVRAIGLSSTSGERDATTQLTLDIP